MTDAPEATPWRSSILAGLASYLDSATIVSTSIALVLYEKPLHLSSWTIGAVSAVLTVSIAVGALVGGRLGDLVGRKRVYAVDLLVYAAGVALLLGAVNAAMLCAGAAVAGLAMGADLPTSLALIAEISPAGRKGRMIGVSALLWTAGITTTAVLSIFASPHGAAGARVLYGHLLLVAAVTWFLRRGMHESEQWSSAATGASGAGRRSLRELRTPVLLAPLLATTAFYTLWNLAANTLGQFQAFLFVNIAHSTAATASLLTVVTLPVGLAAGIGFLRIADSPRRNYWFAVGSIVQIVGFLLPLLAGFTPLTLCLLGLAMVGGGAFAGEAIYKVWSQEFFPTLLRSTAQGATFGVTRGITAGFAVLTPSIAVHAPRLLLGILLACVAGSGLLGALTIPRLALSRATTPWAQAPADQPTYAVRSETKTA
jgi:MFS transporter, SP family, inositol transporter